MGFNQISKLENLPPKIEVLSLNNNIIEDLPLFFSEMNHLVTLDLSHNKLSAVGALKKIISLRVLFLNHNKVIFLKID